MGKAARAEASQTGLFDYLDVPMKEEPKNIAIFPKVTEFPKEKQARKRIRQRREAGAPPSTPKRESVPKEASPGTPERIVEPTVSSAKPLESPPRRPTPVTPGRQSTSPALVSMSGAERLVTMLIGGSGIAAAGMSVYHGYHYLVAAGKPSWVAMITAVIMVIFSSTIFAFPFRRRFFGWALRGLGLATVSFSIFSTIAVNYNQFSTQEEVETYSQQVNEANRVQAELLRLQLNKLDEQIDDLKKEMEYWKDKSWARRDAADTALQAAYTKRSAVWQAVNTATEAAYQVETKTVFTYLAGLFRIKKSLLEFILFCIPAVFYDLLAALAVNAVFCTTKRKEDP